MTDYLIVGGGLAGIAFAETALQHNKTVLVFEDDSLHSSLVAGGVYNPVILKRFSGLSGAQEQLDAMNRFFEDVEARIGQNFNHPMPIWRKFSSVEEQNNWFAASDKPSLSPFLSTELIRATVPHIDSPHGFGEVLQAGFVDTAKFVAAYRKFLESEEMLVRERFDHRALEIHDDYIVYNSVKARHIIFADGFGIRYNPYFSYLPLAGTKGEVLVIHCPALTFEKAIVKSDVFVIPLGNHFFKVGATYEWTDKTEMPTAAAKAELIEKLSKLVDCDFEVVDHKAGIRPTVKDRKPLVGTHPKHQRLHLLNGLGTRGVMLAPQMAGFLFNHIESGTSVLPEVSIERFSPV